MYFVDDDCTYLIVVMGAARSSENHLYIEQGLTLEEILQFISKLLTGNADRKVGLNTHRYIAVFQIRCHIYTLIHLQDLMIKCGLLENLDQLLDKDKFSESEIMACLELLWELVVSESSKDALVQVTIFHRRTYIYMSYHV